MSNNREDEKDIQILFNEIKRTNNQLSLDTINFINDTFNKIDRYYNTKVIYMQEESLKKEISTLKKLIKNDPNNSDYHIKLITFMKQINQLINGYKPRNIQIIAILLFLYKEIN